MPESLLWWAAVQLVGVAVTPIALALFRWLPDRGYVFGKSLGLLLVAYVYWVGDLTGVLPNGRFSILGIVLALAVVSALVTWRTRADLDAYLRRQWRYILFAEVLFAVAFATAAVLRSYAPDIASGEKPMNFAFLNALLRADSFPPQDPWLSGHTLSYYYFGHLMVASLTKISGVEPGIAFNLGGVLLVALAVLNVFAVVYNLVLGKGRAGRALVFGLVAVVLLAVLSNLEGLFELLAAHGVGSKGFYGALGISGLDGPRSTDAWYPTEPYWWWRVTRIASVWDQREFPFIGFLGGDIHPHMSALPFDLLVLGLALNLLRSPAELSHRFWLRSPWWLAVIALAVGAIGFINTWDLPTFFAVVLCAVLAQNFLREGRLNAAVLLRSTAFLAPLAILATALFLPFYTGFHPVGEGIQPLETANRNFPSIEALATRPHHFLYTWATLLAVAASFAVVALPGKGRWGRPRAVLPAALLPGLTPVALWAVLVLARRGPVGFGDELATRGASWITVALLVGLLVVVSLAFLRHLRAPPGEETDRSMLFALGALGTGTLLILGTEFFWAQDPVNLRTNTVFRLGFQAWVLLAVAAAFGLHYVTAGWKPALLRQRAGRWAWAGAVAVVLAAGLIYPVTVTFYRTDDFQGHQSLDGLVLVSHFDRHEYDATIWLRDNVQGTPVVLEAIGESYSSDARISSRTGLPTVLGWPDHEYRWRDSWSPQGDRREDVKLAYETTSVREAAALLEKYDVRYVYVGGAERDTYGERGMAKFAKLGEIVYQNPKVTIYRIGGCDAVLC
jgi:YYY domain-containing protein